MKLYKRKENDTAPLGQADPYILSHGGKYYIYATHEEGVQLYSSENFADWIFEGFCFAREGEKSYWAPAVMEYKGTFYMYYSSMPKNEEDCHTQRIQVAKAQTPAGPFQYVCDLLPPFSIDAHAVNTPAGLYLFYSVNDYEAQRAGTLIVLDKLIDPYTVEGNPKVVVRPTIDEEIFMRDRFRCGQHWHTIEGAFYFYKGDRHYLLYSGSAYTNETYFIGYSTAEGTPADLRDLQWSKYPDDDTYCPLIAKNDCVEGTGHNSLIEIDGKMWIVYHARDMAGGNNPIGEDVRVMRADIMEIDGDRLSVEIL